MKIKHVILAAALLLSLNIFAQKDELKTLKKIFDKKTVSSKDVTEYKSTLEKADPLVAGSNELEKAYLDFYKSGLLFVEIAEATGRAENQNFDFITPQNAAKLAESANNLIDFEQKAGKQVLTKSIQEKVPTVKQVLLNYAIKAGNEKKYTESASMLYSIYLLDKKDVDKLYYAATYAVNGKDYNSALKYYNELIRLNYSGEGTVYWATSVASNKEENFSTKQDRDNFVKLKTHTNPRDEKLESKRGEIYKNVALILVEQGKTSEAKKAITDARASNPDDISLILTEADLYLKENDFAGYSRVAKEALEKNPKDATLLYNLGVISSQANKNQEAEQYYLKALEIKPDYADAYLNLAVIKLSPEKSLIDKMNKLGTSAADNKQYEIYKKQRQDIFKSAIPYLEKSVELSPENIDAARTLLNVYNALEITDKAKALKAKVKDLEAKGGK